MATPGSLEAALHLVHVVALQRAGDLGGGELGLAGPHVRLATAWTIARGGDGVTDVLGVHRRIELLARVLDVAVEQLLALGGGGAWLEHPQQTRAEHREHDPRENDEARDRVAAKGVAVLDADGRVRVQFRTSLRAFP